MLHAALRIQGHGGRVRLRCRRAVGMQASRRAHGDGMGADEDSGKQAQQHQARVGLDVPKCQESGGVSCTHSTQGMPD